MKLFSYNIFQGPVDIKKFKITNEKGKPLIQENHLFKITNEKGKPFIQDNQ